MGDYRRVNETQDKSAPDTPAAGHGSTPDPAVQPIKPVIPAAAAKRANASVIGMIIALVVSIAAFLPIVLMNPAPKSDGFRPNIDVSAVAGNAADVAGFTPVTPDTGDTFSPNYARWEAGTGTGVPTWEVGYLTPKEAFIGLVQRDPHDLLGDAGGRPRMGAQGYRQGREEHGAEPRRHHRCPER